MAPKNPKRACGGYKTAFTRKITKAEEYTAVTDREYSDIEEKNILDMIEGLKEQISRWESDFQSNLSHELEEADYTTYEGELSEQMDVSEKTIKDLQTYLQNLRSKPRGPNQGGATVATAAGGNSQPKIDDTLKPESYWGHTH